MAAPAPPPVDPIAEARRQWLAHDWSEAADGMAFVTSVMRAQQLILARVESALKPFGLSFARYEMLRLLAFARRGGMPMASATRRLQVHPTSVTNTVDRLEAASLLQRLPHPTDGRATIIQITDAGRAVCDEATVELNRFFARPGMPTADVERTVSLLTEFRRSAGDFVEED